MADLLDQLIDDTRAFVHARPVPDVTPGVMRQIAALDVRHAKGSADWVARFMRGLWTGRQVTFQFRPVYGLLVAASLVVLAGLVQHERRGFTEQRVLVQFRLQVSDATNVRLAGTFTHWQQQYALHETAPGVWTVTLPLVPGVHDYAFVIDGQRWVTDPYAPAVEDGFGGRNSRMTLMATGDQRL